MPFRSLILRVAPTDQPKPTDETVQARSQPLLSRNDRRALAALVRSRGEQTFSDMHMAAVRVPTLGLIGSADANIAAMNQLKSVLHSLKVVVIDGATHGGERGAARRPEFVDNLREFIAAHKQTSSSSGAFSFQIGVA